MAVAASPAVVLKCFVSRRIEKNKKQRKRHQLAQLIRVIKTLAILVIVIPELTNLRTTNCLGHLHMLRPLKYRQIALVCSGLQRIENFKH